MNDWYITKLVLTKQKSYSNETKINNKRINKINFLYHLINEKFILWNT